MHTNIEIKAKISDRNRIAEVAGQLSDTPVKIIRQKDIYYNIPRGRLKLRIINDNESELIFYRRNNVSGPKKSFYIIHKEDSPESLDLILSSSLGQLGTVEKKRYLYLTGQTRIHVDDVRELGSFVELEVVLKDKQPDHEGIRIANHIMNQLDIVKEQLVQSSYIDLLISKKTDETPEIQD